MNHPKNIHRFRINPIELGIFLISFMFFFNSLYNLFYNQTPFHPTALTTMNANPTSEGRALASAPQPLMNLTIHCDESNKITQATKVRLKGPLCGLSPILSQLQEEVLIVKATVTNRTNHYESAVFSDLSNQTFSTEYIPLNSGKNEIHLEFAYTNNNLFEHDFIISH